jgi:hypothetical protein
VSFVIGDHNKTSNPLVELLAVLFLQSKKVRDYLALMSSSAKRLAPKNLEHLPVVSVRGEQIEKERKPCIALTSPGLNMLEC